MTPGDIIGIYVGGIWDAFARHFVAAPLLWSSFIVSIAGLTGTMHEALERRGWRAAAWGLILAIGLGVMFAVMRSHR